MAELLTTEDIIKMLRKRARMLGILRSFNATYAARMLNEIADEIEETVKKDEG